MNVPRAVILVTMTVLILGCATNDGLMADKPLNRATIELWRDAADKCHTNTTPFFRLKKNTGRKVAWRILDDTGCLSNDLEVEVKFKSGQTNLLPNCSLRGKSRIECNLDEAVAGTSDYSVWFGSAEEDPKLEIEQP